jgi:Cys-rich repeat protein
MKLHLMPALLALWVPLGASANLCEKSNITDRYKKEVAAMHGEWFAPTTPDYAGDDDYNAWILACNRQRDNQGKDIDEKINPTTGGRFASDLPPVSVKGQYSFYGNSVAANAFTSLEYRYRLRRSQGTWIVTLPIEFKIPGVVYGRDMNANPVPILSNRLDISQPLAVKLGLMSHDGRGNLECDQGREKWKRSPPGVTPERVVDTGFIGPAPDTYDGIACRLPLNRTLAAGKPLLSEYYNFWERVIETAWSRPGFSVEVWIVGHIDIDANVMKTLERDDQIWPINTTLDPNQRARYRSAFLSDPHLYTGAYPGTIAHESGHELGLDDEYRENDRGGRNAWRDCAGEHSELPGANYIMCLADSASVTWVSGLPGWWEPPYTIANTAWWTAPYQITNPEAAKGIYPWIITRRYVVGLPDPCYDDADCKERREYCDKGVVAGVGRNQCMAKKKENESCDTDSKCIAPAICKGKPLGRCATEASVELGGACTRDLQCKTGSCNADGRCQCTSDTDCADSQYCDKGSVAGAGRNQCLKRKAEDESCSADFQCTSPAICKGKPLGRCATEATVELGGSCTRDLQCKTGSCNADGRCQCTSNTDCADSQYCDKGSVAGAGRNQCLKRRAENESCSEDSQCTSPAICKGKPLGRCATESSVGIGGSCSRDSQCKSGSCDNNGVCQCTQNSDCGSGGNWVCDKGTLGVGRNVCVNESATLDLGAQCMRDSQCSSGSCSSKGHCQCKEDKDCKNKNQTCKTPITKENYCE